MLPEAGTITSCWTFIQSVAPGDHLPGTSRDFQKCLGCDTLDLRIIRALRCIGCKWKGAEAAMAPATGVNSSMSSSLNPVGGDMWITRVLGHVGNLQASTLLI